MPVYVLGFVSRICYVKSIKLEIGLLKNTNLTDAPISVFIHILCFGMAFTRREIKMEVCGKPHCTQLISKTLKLKLKLKLTLIG